MTTTKFEHNKKLVSAIITEAKKGKAKFGKLKNVAHKQDIAFYAMMEYDVMRTKNPNLPKLKELDRIGDNDQFIYSQKEVREAIHTELKELNISFK